MSWCAEMPDSFLSLLGGVMLAITAVLTQLPEAEAFSRWLEVDGDWVEEPNVRRGGMSGVKRIYTESGKVLYRKQQDGHIYRSLRHPLGYPTVMREREALLALHQLDVAVPPLVYAACRKTSDGWQALLVTEGLDGYRSLEEHYAEGAESAWGEALHGRIIEEVGRVIGRLNSGRWQHGCIRLKHVFVRVTDGCPEVALLDLEKSRRRFFASLAARHDLQLSRRRLEMSDALWERFLMGYQSSYGASLPRVAKHG